MLGKQNGKQEQGKLSEFRDESDITPALDYLSSLDADGRPD
jgi:hypothetical protein